MTRDRLAAGALAYSAASLGVAFALGASVGSAWVLVAAVPWVAVTWLVLRAGHRTIGLVLSVAFAAGCLVFLIVGGLFLVPAAALLVAAS